MIEIIDGKALGKTIYGIPDGRYYSIQEYCIIYNLNNSTVRKWKERGHIRAVQVFGKSFIPENQEPHNGKNGRPRKLKNVTKSRLLSQM